jgi:UPF0755 protein
MGASRWVTLLLLTLISIYFGLRIASGAATAMLDSPFDGNAGAAVDVTISPGDSAAQVATMLQREGIIRSSRGLRWWMRWSGTAGAIQTGLYRFRGPATLREVSRVITEGRVLLASVTVIEGSTRWQVAEALAAAGFGSYDEAWEATGNAALIADVDPEATDLEGYLFPDTYHAPRDAGADDIVDMMVARFRALWTEERAAAAAAADLSVRQVVTIASLVEAETARAAERPLVSGVYHNRLRDGMLLQCDPTLLYALYLEGRRDRNIRRADFDNPSPYNTYRVRGLPPGPIGNPGLASLDAALHPADTEFLYFVGRNDGSHAFARTLREHNANVNRYQR